LIVEYFTRRICLDSNVMVSMFIERVLSLSLSYNINRQIQHERNEGRRKKINRRLLIECNYVNLTCTVRVLSLSLSLELRAWSQLNFMFIVPDRCRCPSNIIEYEGLSLFFHFLSKQNKTYHYVAFEFVVLFSSSTCCLTSLRRSVSIH
jgi:hypothetical protein